MSISDSRYHLRNSHHPKGTRIMTDNTIPADKVKEIRDEIKHIIAGGVPRETLEYFARETLRVTVDRLDSLLPKPRTLADELRKYAEKHFSPAGLFALADRVETLEQERDELKRRIGDRGVQYSATLKMPPNQREILESMGADLGASQLMKELAEARELAEEQAAEIARLEGLEVPGGWRVANHDRLGPVIAADTLDSGKHHCVFRSNVGPGISQTWVDPALLSFCDEASEPQSESEEEFLGKVEQDLTDRYGPAPTPEGTLERERDEARVLVEEQADEIARLRAREIPDGWRIADHPEYGTVIADPREYSDGDVIIRHLNENQFVEARLVPVYELSFRDEAPAPQPEMDA